MAVNVFHTLMQQARPLSLHRAPEINEELQKYYDLYQLHFCSDASHFFGYIDMDEFRISAHVWQPESSKGTVFMVHGYLDHSGLYTHIISFFLSQSLTVFIYDLPGHGLSTGERAGIRGFAQYSDVLHGCLQWADGKLFAPWYLFGQSTGAAIIADSLVHGGLIQTYPIEKVVFFSPLVRIPQWHMIKYLCYFLSPFIKNIQAKQVKTSNDKHFMLFLDKDPLRAKAVTLAWLKALYQWVGSMDEVKSILSLPVCIIQGENDTTVDWKYNLEYLSNIFDNLDILLLPEAYHHLANESQCIRQKYTHFLRTWLMDDRS